MRAFKHIAIIMAALISLSSCKRIPLYEASTRVYLQIDHNLGIDHNIELSQETSFDSEYLKKIEGKMPEYVEVLFYDTHTHLLIKSQILNADGGQIHLPVGEYDMVIYSFGTESTQTANTHHRFEAEAFTSDITKQMASKLFWIKEGSDSTKTETRGYEDDPIIHEPDHLYVAHVEKIEIPSFEQQQEDIELYATSKSIIEVYSLEVVGVEGTENIEKVEAFITGQIESNYFGAPKPSNNAATLYTDMRVDTENKRLYSLFGTFGKQPGEENKIYLDITVTDSGGGQYRYIFDVTEQFDDPANDNNKLIIDATEIIDIPDAAHGGSGLSPSVDPWEDVEVDIPLG